MKTIGIALLFGLCCMIGVRLSAKKTAPLKAVRELLSGLCAFSDCVTGGATLSAAAESSEGLFFERLSAYLSALKEGAPQAIAAKTAGAQLKASDAVSCGAERFFNGLSQASGSELPERIDALKTVLERAEREAEGESKQARVLRSAGFLIGTGLAILLL